MSSLKPRPSRSRVQNSESSGRRQAGSDLPSSRTTDSTIPLRSDEIDLDDDDDAGEDGLFLGFEHRMNTDERRRMRELEQAKEEARPRSYSPGIPHSRTSTYSTSKDENTTSVSSRYDSSRASQEASHKPSSRRTAYSRELEKRDRQKDRTSRSDEMSSLSEDAPLSYSRSAQPPSTSGRWSSRGEEEEDSKSHSRGDKEEASPYSHRHREGRSSRDAKHRSRSADDESAYTRRNPFNEDDEERRRRREERKLREKERYGDDDEERRRRREDRRRRERGDEDDEERTRRREERKLREERRAARRGTDYRSADEDGLLEPTRSPRRATDYKSADEDTFSEKAERDKRRQERRRLRESEYDDDYSAKSERRHRELERSRAKSPEVDYHSRDPERLTTQRRSFEGVPLHDEVEPPSFSRARSDQISSFGRSNRLRERMLGESKDSAIGVSKGVDRHADLDYARPSSSVSSKATKTGEEEPAGTPTSRKMGILARAGSQSDSSSDAESEPASAYVEVDDLSDNNEEKWTVRVCLISAVDLPFNVIPNVPLCPVLKLGLVKITPGEMAEAESSLETSHVSRASSQPKSAIAEKIEKDGLLSIPKARVRCTSSKILSKRDNGSMEFHEEMRWDDVTRPTQTALAVELCARAALTPPNINEGPLATVESTSIAMMGTSTVSLSESNAVSNSHAKPWIPASRAGAFGVSSSGTNDDYDDIFQRAIGKKTGDNAVVSSSKNATRSGSNSPSPQETPGQRGSAGSGGFGLNSFVNKYSGKEDQEERERVDDDVSQLSTGIAGMRALWRKGKQQFEQRQAAKRKSTGPDETEAATAAAAVARFLIGGNNNEAEAETGSSDHASDRFSGQSMDMSGTRRDVFRSSTIIDQSSTPSGVSPTFPKRTLSQERGVRSVDENVALTRPKKKRKIDMAQDLRLGSLLIPLTKLPLSKATSGNEAARIEQWYQLDTTNNSLVPVSTARRGLSTASKLAARRNPSVLLEISFSSPTVLDESEDELEIESDKEQMISLDEHDELEDASDSNLSFSRRASIDLKKQQRSVVPEPEKAADVKKKIDEDPVLEPGVCDFIAVVGASNIGDQSQDNGAKGWVNSNPECSVLEQFPPNDEFHYSRGRLVTLQNKAEWFCFPEGCHLWRGAEPPSHMDLNLKRFSASSPPNVASSIAAFDACLNCTTSFSWFVIQSNEKENDFKNMKTYGAVIKFYAPAPPGIDATQDDFAQSILGSADLHGKRKTAQTKRLWVPLGILLTSNLPIVGTMEAMLLRLCEALASRVGGNIRSTSHRRIQQIIHQDLANLIINYQKPIPGVLHCSIPFLTGERLHLTLPPPTALPPLPHGASVTSVCRLLGSEGLNVLLAAVLTECKILIHSDEIANLAMVAEVVTALMYPFVWSLPYLPVLPDAMLEFVEAPLSYFIGIPSCNMKLIDESIFSDVVVIDLDNGFTSADFYDGRRGGRQTKTPTPLPASVASNISKAVFRLLREEEEVEEEYGANNMHGTRSLPRLEAESLAEREFRIAVALQICSLVRGYDECLFKVSTAQPVFNRDKFLRTAPALFEDRRTNLTNAPSAVSQSQKMLSPRSKRFLSILVNCQHFHQFLECLDHDECAFFNEVMYTFDMSEDKREDDTLSGFSGYGSGKLEEAASHLSKALQKVEDKIPTYRVDRTGKKKKRSGGWDDDDDDDGGGVEGLMDPHDADHDLGFSDDGNLISSFTSELLQQISIDPSTALRRRASSSGDEDTTLGTEVSERGHQGAISAQFLAEFEKGNHWEYKRLFDIPIESDPGKTTIVSTREKVKLREAIGERRYRAWKVAQEQKNVDKDNTGRMFTGDLASTEGNTTLDLTSLLSQVSDETSTTDASSVGTFSSFSTQSRKISSSLTPEQQRVQDAKDRDVLRRCLERAYEGSSSQRRGGRRRASVNISSSQHGSDPFFENGRDLIADAEAALRNPSAQKFLISVLSQRSRLENQRKRRSGADDRGRRGGSQPTVSRLEAPAFDCLVRLCCAMLDACLENKNYQGAYNLLTQTQGFCTIQAKDGKPLSKKDATMENSNIVYMTARISLHPIFAELDLWEGVLQMKLAERERERKEDEADSKDDVKDTDEIDYDTTVSTLYEMLAFGVPSEELARFATCVSEKKGWFATERGHNLLLQARRLSAKRENTNEGAGNTGDLDMMRGGKMQGMEREYGSVSGETEERSLEWRHIGWCHPAAPAVPRPPSQVSKEGEMSARVGQNLLNMIGNDRTKDDRDAEKYLKRSPVTTLASFGPSIVASGGLDGSVFVAHTIQSAEEDEGSEDVIKGVRLDWGSSGSRTNTVGSSSSMDGEYGVGAVSCLAAAKGAGYRNATLSGSASSYNRDVGGRSDEDDMLQAMEGCRVVAGTTGGDLRVWSVKEVYAATVVANKKGDSDEISRPLSQMRLSHGGEDGGLSSSIVSSNRRGSITEIAAGTAFSRLKVSLRGRALSGHRGGVSCLDVPSHIYRPDALVTGGADGFIKLWSLRNPTGRRASGEILSASSSSLFNTSSLVTAAGSGDPLSQARTKGSRGGDALSILSGHTGRVLCVKTAWHGDRLLTGGADRTVRIWDLASGSGKCLHELRGHLGWVIQCHYWGPNTVVSASTDRSIALWDARVRRSPLFVLRHHKCPVSDLLVGGRTDPLMVSAASDSTIATWDFRTLSGSNSEASKTSPSASSSADGEERKCKTIRNPPAMMNHVAEGKRLKQSGAVLLARGPGQQRRTFLSVGFDSVVREWDIVSGRQIHHDPTYHVDVISSFQTLADGSHTSGVEPTDNTHGFGGTITSSWDGTIRMKKLIKQ